MLFNKFLVMIHVVLNFSQWIHIYILPLQEKSGLNPGTAITPGQHKLLLSRLKGLLVPSSYLMDQNPENTKGLHLPLTSQQNRCAGFT